MTHAPLTRFCQRLAIASSHPLCVVSTLDSILFVQGGPSGMAGDEEDEARSPWPSMVAARD
jgi:hypothetical protein